MESREKLPLPLSAARHTCAKHQWLARVVRLAIRLLYTAIAAIAVNAIVRHGFEWQSSLADGLADFFVHLNGEAALSEPSRLLREDPICPQVEPWTRPPDIAPLPTTPPREMLAKLLSGAVQVDTSVYDDFPLPVESDPELWARVFEPFQRYLAQAFPNVHNAPDKITLEVINEHGLLYTWKGKNATLPPLIFMAHQGKSRAHWSLSQLRTYQLTVCVLSPSLPFPCRRRPCGSKQRRRVGTRAFLRLRRFGKGARLRARRE